MPYNKLMKWFCAVFGGLKLTVFRMNTLFCWENSKDGIIILCLQVNIALFRFKRSSWIKVLLGDRNVIHTLQYNDLFIHQNIKKIQNSSLSSNPIFCLKSNKVLSMEPWAAARKSFKLVWWCHQLLSGFLAKGHLLRVSCQSRRSLMIRMIMKWYRGWAQISWHLPYSWGKPQKTSARRPSDERALRPVIA